MNAMININNLSVEFFTPERNIRAVHNVTLDVDGKEKVAIVGETGSGKSVLLLAVLNLLPKEAVLSGTIRVAGHEPLTMNRKQLDTIRGSVLAYIPQGSGDGLNPLLRVGRQVGEPLVEHRDYSQKEAFAAAVRLLDRFHIDYPKRRAKQYPHHFSGGMKQRALVGMGVSAGADVILADEPTKGIDKNRVSAVADAFLQLEDKTVLCVTHDLNFARKISRKIYVMYAAELVEIAETETFFQTPKHPYSKAVLAALPEYGLNPNIGFAPPHDEGGDKGCIFHDRCPYRLPVCFHEKPPMAEVNQKNHKAKCWNYVDRV
jgi:peptide/nickel transport system ATP-binding protein